LRLIRLLRLVRIMRIVRLLRFVFELRTMVTSIAASFRYLCWTVVLIFLIIYIVGVFIIQLIANQAHENGMMETGLEQELELYYGSLLTALLSLFQAMTGGVDWSAMLNPLMEHISPWIAAAFVLYISFVVLAMMNIITGIFVEGALQTAKEDKESDLLVQLTNAFKKADIDGSGMLTWEEFSQQLSEPSMVKYFKALDIDTSEARGLFALLDTGNKGMIDVEAFAMGCLQLRGVAKSIDVASMMYFNKRMAKMHIDHMENVEEELEFVRRTLCTSGGASLMQGGVAAQGRGLPQVAYIVDELTGLVRPIGDCSVEFPHEGSGKKEPGPRCVYVGRPEGRGKAQSCRCEQRVCHLQADPHLCRQPRDERSN